MKIVHLYKDYYPPVQGGIEVSVNRLAVAQVRRGHDVTVLVSASGGRHTREEMVDGVRVIRVAEWARALSAPICPSMPRSLARLSADVYHLQYPNPTGELSWALVRPRGAIVVTFNADITRQRIVLPFYRPLVRALLRRADLVLGSSKRLLEGTEFLRSHLEKCRVIPHGIDLARFGDRSPHAARAAEIRARLGGPIVLFVGRLRHYKGLDYMLRAMVEVPARFVIVGEGPEEPRLRALHAQLGLGERVTFAGHVEDEDLPAWIHAADVGVLPSSNEAEAWGLAMIEMMAAGVPMVCTELGTGTSVVNLDGETGLVVPPRDPTALAAAVRRLIEDDGLRARLGAGAKQRARGHFSREAMVDGVEAAYVEALDRHRGTAS